MTLQPALFDLAPTVTPDYDRNASIQERFNAFHRANPHVFRALRSLCLGMKRRGHNQWSIKAAFEIIRWQYAMQTTDNDFKLNNNYHALYARKIMADVPELRGFFETRKRISN